MWRRSPVGGLSVELKIIILPMTTEAPARNLRVSRSIVRTQIAVADGQVAHCILEAADIWNADLIVMATHGRTGLRRWVYGSVTEKILRSANCSMLIVRPTANSLN